MALPAALLLAVVEVPIYPVVDSMETEVMPLKGDPVGRPVAARQRIDTDIGA